LGLKRHVATQASQKNHFLVASFAIPSYNYLFIQNWSFLMAIEQTLSILKPDAVSANNIGAILSRFEKAGLKIVAAKMVHMTTEQAKAFYAVHAHRPFFQELVTFMIEGPALVMVLEGENAIAKNRDLMGATNPREAAPGTIRADFAKSIDKNAVHGSDSPENAKKEIAFFFKQQEIFSR
jgi:nucleoside-diphosphate kinase